MSVVKKEGTRIAYDRGKMLAGLQRACHKRPVSADALSKLVDDVEEVIFREFEREVPSSFIGAQLADRLLALDKIAYIRFVSVNQEFQALNDFIEKARDAADRALRETPGQQDLFK